MDERVLERMLLRYPHLIVQPAAWVVAITGVFVASLLWIGSTTLCSHFLGYFHKAVSLFSLTLSLLPLCISFFFLAFLSYSTRAGEKISFQNMVKRQHANFSSYTLISALFVIAQALLATTTFLWLCFERIPIIGTVVYIVSSYIPLCLVGLMAVVLCTFVVVFPTMAIVTAKSSDMEQLSYIMTLLKTLQKWVVLRLKLTIFGMIPLVVTTGGTLLVTTNTSSSPLEPLAIVIRAFVFAIVASPSFFFLVHMVIEVDRYITWRSLQGRSAPKQ